MLHRIGRILVAAAALGLCLGLGMATSAGAEKKSRVIKTVGVWVAFDAENIRYALLWKGRFLDARPHWTGQSSGSAGPRGHDVVKLPQGPSWTIPSGPAKRPGDG